MILFSVAFLAHLLLLLEHRTWYFSTTAFGTAMEIVGYVFRILASQVDPYSVINFVIQYFFIVVAPVFFSAAIYAIISVMVNRVGREYAPLPPKVVLWIFVACDIIATVVQVTGSALIGAAESKRKDPNPGNHILIAGLSFQVFDFALFIAILATFLWNSRKVTSSAFKQFSAAVVVATLAVYLRTCFRLAETAQGVQQYLFTHEVFFGCLEFLPIAVAVYVFIWYHPGCWLGSKRRRGKAFADDFLLPQSNISPI